MATIEVGSEWRLKGDAYCWAVEHRRVVQTGKLAGRVDWDGVSFHASIGKAAVALAQRQIRTADVEGVQAVMDEWARITGEIDAALAEWRPAA